jgi:hypothetical protein
MNPTVLIVAAVMLAYLAGKTMAGLDPFTIQNAVPRVSKVDSLTYRVHDQHDNPQDAVDMMARINNLLIDVQQVLREQYVRRKGGTPAEQAAVRNILRLYNPDNLVENSPRDPNGDTSYSLDKGRVVAFCMRDKRTQQLHNFPVMAFVALHELAHLALLEYGHPPEFWSAFKFILQVAANAGIYVSPDFGMHPERYCGMDVNYNPYYDPAVPAL